MTINSGHPTGAIHESGPPDDEAPDAGLLDTGGEVMVPLSEITSFLLQEDALLKLRAKRVQGQDPGLLGDPASVVDRGVELAEIAGQRNQLRRHVSRLVAKTGVEIVPVDQQGGES